MEKLFGGKVYLEVWVRVRSGWEESEGHGSQGSRCTPPRNDLQHEATLAAARLARQSGFRL